MRRSRAMRMDAAEMRELRFRRRCGARGALAGLALLALPAMVVIDGSAALRAWWLAAPPPALQNVWSAC